MTDRGPTRTRIERQLVGEPIRVGERTIQPVARVTGWHGSGGSETDGGAGVWLHVTPIEVVVHESDGNEHRVSVTDPTREAMRGIVSSALMVAVVCWLLMLVLRRKRT